MAGTLKVGTITTPSGTGTITIPSGVTLSGGVTNTPTFLATRDSSNQTVSDDTATKVQLNDVAIDTNSAFDNTTNYRFTVPTGQAGNYYFFAKIQIDSDVNTNFDVGKIWFYKNGSSISDPVNGATAEFNFLANPIREAELTLDYILNLSVGDYVELYGHIEAADSTGGTFKQGSYFGGYKLGN